MSEDYVTCKCQHCSGKISFDAGDFEKGETRNAECPHCHLDTIIFVPQSTLAGEKKKVEQPKPEPKEVVVEIKKGASPLGIASLVIGIIAILFCWIPFLGLLSIPIAGIGFLLAVIGITISCVSKKTGFVFSISGGIVCIFSVLIALLITGGISKSVSYALQKSKQTNQKSVAEIADTNGTETVQWSKSASVMQGDIKVTVQKVHIGRVDNNDIMGQAKTTEAELFTIDLSIENLSTTKKVDFQTWRGLALGNSAALTDNNSNNYARIDITPSKFDGTSFDDSASIYPEKEQLEEIVFEAPVEKIEWLHLELPAENIGGSGMLRFEIPMQKISAARQAIQKAKDDYQNYVNTKPYETNADYIKMKGQRGILFAKLKTIEQQQKEVTKTYLSQAMGQNVFGDARQQQNMNAMKTQVTSMSDQLEAGYKQLNELDRQTSKIENGSEKNAAIQSAISNLTASENEIYSVASKP